uniref:Endonuclease/exonuclease/phosphatase domain-containing protein n=1 Tax=Chrysotila carterae TaxID=13221 RepID=A0A7S4ESS7_CHRCT
MFRWGPVPSARVSVLQHLSGAAIFFSSSFLRVGVARTGATRAAWPFDRQGPPCETWRLDHILFTRRTLRPKIVWSALESDPLACRVGLPNAHCPSDHLPVGASFEFAPPTAIDEPKRADIAARLKQLEAAQVEQVNRLHKALCDEEAQLSSPVLTGKDRKKSREQPPAEVLHYLAPCLMWHSEKDHARQKQVSLLLSTSADACVPLHPIDGASIGRFHPITQIMALWPAYQVMEFIRGKRQRQKALKLLQQSEREKFVRSLEGEAEQDMLDDVLRATRNVQIDEWIDGHVNA